ncbi:MAG: formylglycine-generating enzyme family protein [Limnohabitans sp.]|nr:formylglycine-generating enzyme family protein [Limnohabitans sp.]
MRSSMNLAVVRVAVALVAMLATACSSKEPATFTSTDPRTGDWFEVLAVTPDPAVVTDAEGRARMVATKLPWKVRDRKTGIVMLLCPPGKFLMGSPETEEDRRDDETQHKRVIRSAFYLSETEVTQDQWRMVMGTNPSFFKGGKNPVEQVSWNDCQRFCTATGLRLPNEAEWEYACRAGTTGAYAGDLGSMAWYRNNSGASTHPVATKAANPWGFHDMHGNVLEWCRDMYCEYPLRGGTEEAATFGSYRVLRGGCWYNFTFNVRSSYRDYDIAPGLTSSLIGFRVARAPL